MSLPGRLDHLEERMERLEQGMLDLHSALHMDRLEHVMIDIHGAMREMSDRFTSEIRAQTRTILLAFFGSIVTLGVAIVGLAVAVL